MKKPFIHDPAVYRDEASGKYYVYTTGANGYVSEDLVH